MFKSLIDVVRTPGRDNPSTWGGESWFLMFLGIFIAGPICAWVGASILSWGDLLGGFKPGLATGANNPQLNPFALAYGVGTFWATVGGILGYIGGLGIGWVAAARIPEPHHGGHGHH